MSTELTTQLVQLLFDNDLISGARYQRDGSAAVSAHYPNGTALTVQGAETNIVCLELDVNGKTQLITCGTAAALEYVKRWSLDLEGGGEFVTSMDEAYSAARDLLDTVSGLDWLDISAVDVKKFTAYITYPRIGNYSVHGLLVRLPKSELYLASILRDCTHED